MTYSKSLERFEQEQDTKLRQKYNATHHAKKEDHHHETFSGISYSEYHCSKLNGYRADDRPYGISERTHWRTGGVFGDSTYSEKTAKDWIARGLEVKEYNRKNEMTMVYNPSRATIEMMNTYKIQLA